jgi:hypothetical protein
MLLTRVDREAEGLLLAVVVQQLELVQRAKAMQEPQVPAILEYMVQVVVVVRVVLVALVQLQ